MTTFTARDIVTDAFVELKVYAPGELVTDLDAAIGLMQLNSMLDKWSNDSLTCYAIQEMALPLVVNQASYTIGIGGNLSVPRPVKVIDGPGAAYMQDAQSNNYPIDVVTMAQWNQIGNRITVDSNIPDTMWYNPLYPLGVLNIFPVPNIAYTLFFDSYLPFGDLASMAAAFSLPPGYQEAVTKNLAIALKGRYPTAKLDATTIALAKEALQSLKRTNARPDLAQYDKEIVARGSSTYNIYSDRGGSAT